MSCARFCAPNPATDIKVSSPPSARGLLGGICVYTCNVRTLTVSVQWSHGQSGTSSVYAGSTVQTSPTNQGPAGGYSSDQLEAEKIRHSHRHIGSLYIDETIWTLIIRNQISFASKLFCLKLFGNVAM